MFRRFSVNFALFSMALDAVLVSLALGLAAWLRPMLNGLQRVQVIYPPVGMPAPVLYGVFPVLWVVLFTLVSVYDGRRNLRWIDELSRLVFGSALTLVSMAGVLYLSYRDVSRLLFLVFAMVAFTGLAGWRAAFRLALQSKARGINGQRQVLIVGAGSVGKKVQEHILGQGLPGITVAGFVDDDPKKRQSRADVLGTVTDTVSLVEQRQISDIVIALPAWAHESIEEVVAGLHKLPVKVWLVPDYFGLVLHKAVAEAFADLPLLDLRAPALDDYQLMLKRGFDLVIILLLFPFALVLAGFIAVVIRLEGNGPVLYRQKRIGENGRLFEIYKFRTMVPGAEKLYHLVEQVDENGRKVYKTPNDPRITRVGRFLRRTSLDELPQLVNVLRGEMSLVGPRPELPHLVEEYDLWQRQRFTIPPGMTGWWQVSGRSDRPMHLHTEDDLYYIQNYSIFLDLKIIFKTVGVVLRGKGAY